MARFLKRSLSLSFLVFSLLSCGDGLYQKPPTGVALAKTERIMYVGHYEHIAFSGKGLKGAAFTVTPALPAGLTIGESGISGTPASASLLKDYSIHIKSDFGETGVTIALKVNLASPSPTVLRDIFTGGSSNPAVLGNIGEDILFAAESNVDGRELWKTDGTTGGTVQVKDIDSGVGQSGAPFSLLQSQNDYPFSDLIFFGAQTVAGGTEIYKTDGTAAGTAQIAHLEPGSIAKAGSHFVYQANDTAGVGVEPFATSSSGGAVTNLADIASGADSTPEFLTELNGSVFFFASDSSVATGKEPYITDGTAAGTSLILDINPGTGDSAGTQAPKTYDGYVYFGADDGVNGLELWRSDGTAAGTTLFKDIASGATSSDPGNFVVWNGILYFTADDNIHGLELWRTDGTASGTYMVKDVNGTAGGSVVTLFEKGGGDSYLFFTADDGVHGEELWRTDGTTAGTAMVKDIDGAATGSAPLQLTAVNGFMYFSASTPAYGREMWRSDGTAAGTTLVADLNSGASDGVQSSDTFYEYQGVLYFPGSTATSGVELFKVTPY